MKKTMHPNSLANLTHKWTSDTAREAQLNGAKGRTAAAERRNKLRQTMNDMKQLQDEISEDTLDSAQMLKVIALQKLEEGEIDIAVDIFKAIAEFEKPKLQRREVKVEETKADDLTDEELEAKLKELLDGKDDSVKDPGGSSSTEEAEE